MISNPFLDLIEGESYLELEDCWLESISTGTLPVEEYIKAAKALGKQREKERATMLLSILADSLKESRHWQERVRVLFEIAKHNTDSRRWVDLRFQIEETLEHLYSGSPSFQRIFLHFKIHEAQRFEELKPALEKTELWLKHDVGRIFYEAGRGIGKVREVNLNLGLIRVDFETRKDVSVEIGDADLISLEEGHILRELYEDPERFHREAMENPANALGRLLRTFGRPLAVNEIKECLVTGIPDNQWAKWWTSAKKNPQLVVSGKGAQATYAWTESSTAADESIKSAFDQASLPKKLSIAKQHAGRTEALNAHFSSVLVSLAGTARAEGRIGVVLEILEVFEKWPVAAAPDPGFTFQEFVEQQDPVTLFKSLSTPSLKTRVIQVFETSQPERFAAVCAEAISAEDNSKLLAFLCEKLNQKDPVALDGVIRRIMERPEGSPDAFTWICETGASENSSEIIEPVSKKLDGKLLLAAFTAIDEPQFQSCRNRLKKALETGLLMNILNAGMEPDLAKKAIDILDHCRLIEDYRKERWKTAIRMRFPEMRKKDEWIFSTREALDRKRAEFDHLVQVELPANRKAVGEAAALGDLSENHEYKAARERQEYLINRVQQLQNDLGHVRVLEPGQIDCSEVRPGTTVTLFQPENQRAKITILGPWDSKPQDRIYSYQSPIGISFLSRVAGDTVEWNDGSWTIEKIDPWAG